MTDDEHPRPDMHGSQRLSYYSTPDRPDLDFRKSILLSLFFFLWVNLKMHLISAAGLIFCTIFKSIAHMNE
jgi:hypothetical protein